MQQQHLGVVHQQAARLSRLWVHQYEAMVASYRTSVDWMQCVESSSRQQ